MLINGQQFTLAKKLYTTLKIEEKQINYPRLFGTDSVHVCMGISASPSYVYEHSKRKSHHHRTVVCLVSAGLSGVIVGKKKLYFIEILHRTHITTAQRNEQTADPQKTTHTRC